MPGLLSCVSGLLDLGAGDADTPKCQWPLHNLGGRKNPVSQLKLNSQGIFKIPCSQPKWHQRHQVCQKAQSAQARRPRPRSPPSLCQSSQSARSVSQQWEPTAYFLWGCLPSKLVHILFLLTLLGEGCIETTWRPLLHWPRGIWKADRAHETALEFELSLGKRDQHLRPSILSTHRVPSLRMKLHREESREKVRERPRWRYTAIQFWAGPQGRCSMPHIQDHSEVC